MKLTTRLLFLATLGTSAHANVILFNDLGPSGNVYNDAHGWAVFGSTSTAPCCEGSPSYYPANLFTVSGSGTEAVSEIDLAVENVSGPDTFYASIWSDDSGSPGSQLAGAYWSLSTSASNGTCCALVSITGISGLTLVGGADYFLVLGPLSATDSSTNKLLFNNQGVTGDDQYSQNGGATWHDQGTQTIGAFDILGGTSAPEPGTLLLLGAGLIGIMAARARQGRHKRR